MAGRPGVDWLFERDVFEGGNPNQMTYRRCRAQPESRTIMLTNGCPHTDRNTAGRVCAHLLGEKDADHIRRFTGVGLTYDLVCAQCGSDLGASEAGLVGACAECVRVD